MKIIILMLMLLIPLQSGAVDSSTDSGKTKKTDIEQSQSLKKSQDSKQSKGKKTSKSKSTGIDKQTQEAVKAIEQAQQSRSADITLDLQAVFLGQIAEMEQLKIEPFYSCRVATHPRLNVDFNLTVKVTKTGYINLTQAQIFNTIASESGLVSETGGDEAGIRQYRDCLALYGSVIGQAYLNLTSDLTSINAQYSDKYGDAIVAGLGLDDFWQLSEGALSKAAAGITNKNLKRTLTRIIHDNAPCRFEKSANGEVVQCGGSQITLSSKPGLIISSIAWYGDKFGGFAGTWKVSKGWSLSDAIEKMKSISKFEKFANEVSSYAEKLESEGRSKEAVQLRKRAWDKVKSGKTNVSIASLLPK